MKKTLYLLSLVLSFGAYAQSGINTKIPKATLQVNAKRTDGSTSEGIIAPRLTGAALHDAEAFHSADTIVYGADQDGTLVFVTEPPIVAQRVGQTSNIDSRGYYYFDATENKWMKATSGNFVTTEIGSLTCDEANFSNTTFTKGVAYSGTFTLPYSGGNGIAYAAESFTSNGLTFSLPGGTLANGNGNLVYTVSGTPNTSGMAYIPISFAGKMCIKTINITLPAANIGSLNCNQAVFSPTPLSLSISYTGTLTVPYTGGNGGSYAATTFTQNGLTFTLAAGNLAMGTGSLVYTVSGTPKVSGDVLVPITIANQSCSVSVNVTGAPAIDSLNCTDAQMVFNPNAFYQGINYTGTLKIQYTGGNGASYPASTFTHNGLTFTLPAGNLAYDLGTLTYQVTGIPSTSGDQTITLNFLGKSCTKTFNVGVQASVGALTCASVVFNPATLTKGEAYSGTLTVPYTGGNGGSYPANTFTHNGLTFSLPAGTLAGTVAAPAAGSLVYTVTGTPTVGGDVNIPITVFNKTCAKSVNITIPAGSISDLACNQAAFSPAVLSQGVPYTGTLRIPYTGSNGGSYTAPADVVENGLTFSLVAGVLDNTSGVIEYQVSGTPTTSGTTNVTLSFLGKTCSVPVIVTLPPSIDNLICEGFEFSKERFYTIVNNTGTLTVQYSGGNGAAYGTSSFSQNGLTFTLRPGTLANGSGSLVFDISGIVTGVATPIDEPPLKIGSATINVKFLGKECPVTITVAAPPVTNIFTEDFTTVRTNTKTILSPYPKLNQPVAVGTTLKIEYQGGNNSNYPAGQSFTVGGLTFTLRAGTLTSNGTFIYDVTGTPTQLSIKVPIDFYGFTNDFYIGLQDDEHLAIKGRIWKRHNLGADTSLDADTPVKGINGNYFKWGNSIVVATADTPNGSITNWSSLGSTTNTWDDTEKSSNDPCPTGFRVPSKEVMDLLLSYISRAWKTNSNEFGKASVFNLSNGSGYKLTFPAAGYHFTSNGELRNRGTNGYYWLSTPNSINAYSLFINSLSANVPIFNRTNGINVRCVSVPEN